MNLDKNQLLSYKSIIKTKLWILIMTRFGSITPTTVNGFTPISVDHSHIAEEAHESGIAKLSLLTRKRDIGLSTTQIEAAAQNVVDQSQIGQVSAGLKVVDAAIDGMLDRLKKYEGLVSQYDKFLTTYPGLELYCVVDYNNSNSAVRRFGIDTDCLVANANQDLAAITTQTVSSGSVKSGGKASSSKTKDFAHLLHPLEVHQIRMAIKHMDAGNKTALVDIFERLEDGNINIGSNGKPGIHTILLSQQTAKSTIQILVIDPSNSEFSRHLMFNKEVICGVDVPVEIVTSPITIKIYAAPSKAPVGPDPDQYRDCTDIAVKLAFGLNKHQALVDMNKLAQLPFVQEITNNKDINESPLLEVAPPQITPLIRIRQSSVDAHREKVQKLLLSTKIQADFIKKYEQDAARITINDEIGAILYQAAAHTDYDAQLVALKASHDAHTDLVGQIMQDFTA